MGKHYYPKLEHLKNRIEKKMSRMAIKDETNPTLLARYRARRSYGAWRKRKEGRLKIATLFAEAKGKCKLCNRDMVLRFDGNHDSYDMATLDHVIPLSVVGEFNPNAEFQVVCQRCNVRKANHIKDEAKLPVDNT